MEKAWLGEDLIDLSRLTRDEIARLNRRAKYTCFTCKKDVIFKNGTRKKAHFAHAGEVEYRWQPEGAEHRLVKECLAKWLRELKVTVEVERRMPAIDRIADVYFEFQGRKYVFEVQKSPMSDLEFDKRIDDYAQIGITVIWIFLGEVSKKKNRYALPAVIQGRNLDRVIHFCTKSARLTVFEQPVFLSAKMIYSRASSRRLVNVHLNELLMPIKKRIWLDETWLEVKEQFRLKGWSHISKSEMKLVEQCLLRGFNLAMVPPVVGWPVPGVAMRKPLFVWQMYVVVILLKYVKPDDVFTVQDIQRFLVMEYDLVGREGSAIQLEMYLRWLMKFGILSGRKGSYRYLKLPEIKKTMESCLESDRILYDQIVNRSK